MGYDYWLFLRCCWRNIFCVIIVVPRELISLAGIPPLSIRLEVLGFLVVSISHFPVILLDE